ncbi:MAG: hypothetical protein AB2598_17040 [Candidatus Thiodiazotropha sp.]
MNGYDKIRVLWIDDREEMDGYPEGQIVPHEYQDWFEIVHPGTKDEALSFRSAMEFAPVVRGFWFSDDTSILPAEIIATDYNLSKRGGVAVVDQTDVEVDKDLNSLDEDDVSVNVPPRSGSSMTSVRGVNFEGLLISLFYGALSYKHPAAIVPMTRYLSEMPSEVETLHALVEPFLGVDFQYIGLEDRRWASILKEGAKQLRRRISTLFKSGDIVVSPSDLEALADPHKYHDVLTIRSPHALRKLPVDGLFVDTSTDNRPAAISEWAEELFEHLVNRTHFNTAMQLVDELWAFYTADKQSAECKQLRDRWMLTERLRKQGDKDEIKELNDRCGVSVKECGVCAEIRNNNYTNDIRRLAVVLMSYRLVVNMLHINAKLEELELSSNFPRLIENDLWFALFPLPKNPIMLPESSPSYRDNNWEAAMTRMELSVPDILQGKGFSADGKVKGLRPTERRLLRCLASDENDLVGNEKLEDSVFHRYISSRLLLWGDDSDA